MMETLRSGTMQAPTSGIEAGALARAKEEKRLRRGWLIPGMCLLLACLSASWFSYQLFLVPQPVSFAPQWHGAQWIQAADGKAPFVCFRYVTDIETLPDTAFVTIAASQVFRLYVNGVFVGTNSDDVVAGQGMRAYVYDVASTLVRGANVLAIRVVNLDQQRPMVRASFGMVTGAASSYVVTNTGWQATAQSSKAYPFIAAHMPAWTARGFDASSWLQSGVAKGPALEPMLRVNPALYEQPMAHHWMSAGIGHEAYFVRTITLPAGTSHTWLRVVATGPSSIFLNGQLFTIWNGQVPIVKQEPVDFLSDNYLTDPDAGVQYQSGLALGVYDISPYLHVGANTLAIHVMAPGNSAGQVGLETLNAAFSLDLLLMESNQQMKWISSEVTNEGWRGSALPVEGWSRGDRATEAWATPLSIGRPGLSKTIYQPEASTTRNSSVFPAAQFGLLLLLSITGVISLWLLMSLLVLRPCYRSGREALRHLPAAYLPASAGEVLLVVLSRDMLIPQPFPYTWQWGSALVGLVMLSYLLLALHARTQFRDAGRERAEWLKGAWFSITRWFYARKGLTVWLVRHWGLLLMMLLAVPMIAYNLNYEPYWQDELTSYYAAKNVLAHGFPLLYSGFPYPKGELYSYLLALSMLLFGEQNGMLRIISVIAYILSLPIFYGVGCYFFERRVALLATAMLAFSPLTLIWGRSVRMYELAQLLAILVMYLFYRALQQRFRPRPIYLAVGVLVTTYLSHEEVFIIFPALVLYVLVASSSGLRRLPWVLTNKHWLIASTVGASIVGAQLLVVHYSHPPILGTDPSQVPFIQFSMENIAYYVKLLFVPQLLSATQPFMAINALLAVVGGIWAIYRGDSRAKYCTLFFVLPFVALVLLFTLRASRYIYPILPAFYLLGAYGLLEGLRFLWGHGHDVITQGGLQFSRGLSRRRAPLILTRLTTLLLCSSALVAPALPMSGYNLFISQALGLSYHRHYTDYDAAGEYVRTHERPGDIVIAISPAISVLYYVGHVDDFFSVDRALYLFERDGHITDTPTGSTPLLSQGDFRAVLSSHARIWVITDQGLYQSGVDQGRRFVFPPEFRVVYRGYGSAVYLRLS